MGPTKETYRDIARDPREDEDWFLRMPVEAQREMRERFRNENARWVPRFERVEQWRNRCLIEGLVCVAGAALVFSTFVAFLVALPIGALTGWIWFQANTGRLLSGGISMAGFVVANVLGEAWSSPHDVKGFLFTAFIAFFCGLLGAAMGLRRELDEREQV